MRFLFVPFILLPILEMVVLIKVGSAIGALNAVALVILGAVIGLQVIRRQGFSTMVKARQKMAAGELPALEMIEGFMIAFGGMLMLLPGFITDFMGVLLLIPGVRKLLIGKIVSSGHWKVQQTEIYEGEYRKEGPGNIHQQQINQTINGDFTREDEEKK